MRRRLDPWELYSQDPQKSIPKGTLLAILLTTVSYLLIAFVAGCTVLRDAAGLEGDLGCVAQRNCSYGLHHSNDVSLPPAARSLFRAERLAIGAIHCYSFCLKAILVNTYFGSRFHRKKNLLSFKIYII